MAKTADTVLTLNPAETAADPIGVAFRTPRVRKLVDRFTCWRCIIIVLIRHGLRVCRHPFPPSIGARVRRIRKQEIKQWRELLRVTPVKRRRG